jgi:hypothetical protein
LKAFALIYGNYCTKIMQTKLQHLPDFTDDIRGDPILLLKSIQILMHDPVRGRYPFASVADAWRTLFFTKQSEGEDILDYSKRFKQNRCWRGIQTKIYMRNTSRELFSSNGEVFS